MIFNLRARRALKSLGGKFSNPFELAMLAKQHERHLTVTRKRMTSFWSKDKRYWFSFCRRPDRNAFAVALSPDRYFLAISSGLVSAIYRATLRVARSSEAFPQLLNRDASNIRVPNPRLRNLHKTFGDRIHAQVSLYAIANGELPPTLPQAQLAFTMAHFALEFVLVHEIGHILNGHLDYQVKHAQYPMPWRYQPDPEFVPENFRQHFEVQSDRDAFRYTLAQLAGLAEEHNWKESPFVIAFGSSYFESRREAVELWTFSIAVLFIVLGTWKGSQEDFSQSTHPYPAFRLEKAFEILTLDEFPGWVEGSRFTDSIKTLEFVAAELDASGFDVGPLLRSLEIYRKDNQKEIAEKRIAEAMRRDEPVLTRVRLDQVDMGTMPPHVKAETENFQRHWSTCLRMMSGASGELSTIMASPELSAVRASPAFNWLVNWKELRSLLYSEAMNGLLADGESSDQRAVALVVAMKDFLENSKA